MWLKAQGWWKDGREKPGPRIFSSISPPAQAGFTLGVVAEMRGVQIWVPGSGGHEGLRAETGTYTCLTVSVLPLVLYGFRTRDSQVWDMWWPDPPHLSG